MASNHQQYNPQGDVGQPQYAQQPMGQQQLQPEPPALPRSISTTNLDTTRRCRSVVQQDWEEQAPPGGTNFFSTLPAFTLTLPTLEAYPKDFQDFVFGRLIDKETQRYLEGEKCLNWCPSATQLVPLYTTGDGNCLLHAASLSMWGFQDRDFTLRRAVYTALQYHKGTHLYRRWKYCRETENRQTGLELEPQQWDYEWQVVVSQAATNAPQGQSLDSLDDFHVFVLANILRRPIIMYAAPKLRSRATGSTLQHINLHGVYLPVMWDPRLCKKDPLPLAYSGGHFVSLVAIEYPQQYHHGTFVLPLADYYGQQFPVRYALHMEDRTALLMDYLDLIQVGGHGSPYITANNISCPKLSIPEAPAYLKPLIAAFIDACWEVHVTSQPRLLQQQQPPQKPKQPFDSRQPQPQYQNKTKCINHCGMYGDPDKFGMCSRCYKKQQHQQFQQQPSQQGHPQQSYQPQPGNSQGEDRPNQPQAKQDRIYETIPGANQPPQPTSSRATAVPRSSSQISQQQPPSSAPTNISKLSSSNSAVKKGTLVNHVPSLDSSGPEKCSSICKEANSKSDSTQESVYILTKQFAEHCSYCEQQASTSDKRSKETTERITELEQSLVRALQQSSNTETYARDLETRLATLEQTVSQLQDLQTTQPSWEISRAEIHITDEEIGRGGWGAIRVAEFRGQRVAAKTLHHQIISPNNIRLFTREMTMAARIHHPNIVQFIGATIEGVPIILSELMNTSLRDQLAVSPFPRNQILSIASDVSRALNYLHLTQPRPIIHRDVSTANILLDRSILPTVWKAKLSDFGSTNFVSNMATAGPGNPLYAAPEALNPYDQTPKMDVFSFGIVLIEAFTREMPSVEERDQLISEISWKAIAPLIRRCINMNKDRRPTMEETITELSTIQQQ